VNGSELVGRLRELSELHDAGALTDEEFAGAKALMIGGANGNGAQSALPSGVNGPFPTGAAPAAHHEIPPPGWQAARPGAPLPVVTVAIAAVAVLVVVAVLLVNKQPGRSPTGDARGTSAPSLAIPDASYAGATDAIALFGGGTAERIQLEVGISHSYSGDIAVQLSAPSGRSVTVFDHLRVSGQYLRIAQDSTSPASVLRALLGEPVDGTWQLTVIDAYTADIGTLDSWTITIKR
jgi:proprotein convertase P-domain-containing protein